MFLGFKVNIDGNELSCDKCTVTLYNQVPFSDQYFEFGTFKIKDLFEEYAEGHCAIKWDSAQGYYHNGN